jgi:uncharacterized protein with ParB-like and HNH nuclease domain
MYSDNREVRVESINLTELFTKKLAIPEYQRPYVWQQANIDSLLEEIHIHEEYKSSTKPMFFVGSIVLHHDAENNMNIIDGQQRITTLSILAKILQQKDYPIYYNNLLSQQNIFNNYSYLVQRKDTLSALDFDKINVVVITTNRQDDAYNFFETLNTGGKRLSGLDILKAHHLRSLPAYEIDSYAELWEKEQAHLSESLKLLIKARSWNYLKFVAVPSKRSGLAAWKQIITDEFASALTANNENIAYNILLKKANSFTTPGNEYAIRQPVGNGENFINYFLSYVQLYKALFVNLNAHDDIYKKFTSTIILNWHDGTVDMRALYQLALLCYVSRFGMENLTRVSLLLFRHIYSLRVSTPGRVMEATVVNHMIHTNIIERILNSYSESDVLKYLSTFPYEFNTENMDKIKGRFVAKISLFLGTIPLDHSNYDQQLKNYINNKTAITNG